MFRIAQLVVAVREKQMGRVIRIIDVGRSHRFPESGIGEAGIHIKADVPADLAAELAATAKANRALRRA